MKKDWVGRLRHGVFKIPGGWCAAAWTPRGLSALVLPQNRKIAALRKLQDYLPPLPFDFWQKSLRPVPPVIQGQTKRALSGKTFSLRKFDLAFLTPFQQRVLEAARRIPRGQFRTYGWIARRADSPRGFRAAGQALNRNPVPLFIPCHRIIAGGNRLGGYGGGVAWKVKLLKNEGVSVIRGIVS